MYKFGIIILISFGLAACGKKGGVEPLENSDYPRTYPKPPPPDYPLAKEKNKESL